MNGAPIASRPTSYINAGWFLTGLSSVMCLIFPLLIGTQAPNDIQSTQLTFALSALGLLVGLCLLWRGYDVCVVADEQEVRWRRGWRWQALSWDDITSWTIQYGSSGAVWCYRVESRAGQSISWEAYWSNGAQLAELVARKKGHKSEAWPRHFVYSGLPQAVQALVPIVVAGLVGVLPAGLMVRMLWLYWSDFPHLGLGVALVVCGVVTAFWLMWSVLRWNAQLRRVEKRRQGEHIIVDGDTLTWSDGAQTWSAPLEEIQVQRQSDGAWAFLMPQGQFIVERVTRWWWDLRRILERRSETFTLAFEDEGSGSNARFGYDRRENLFPLFIPLIFALACWANVTFADITPSDRGIILPPVVGTLLSLALVMLAAMGAYAWKKMAYEVSDEGLWRQGLWNRQLMPWSDVTEVGKNANALFVQGQVEGQTMRWSLSPFFAITRPATLQHTIRERAPQVSKAN